MTIKEGDTSAVLEHDGLHLPTIKRHSLEKIARHNRYASIFATAMAGRWPQRAYIGLFAGAGRARLADTGEIVETSALAVHRQSVPFTHHIYVDHDPQCITALESRIGNVAPHANSRFITRDVNESASEVLAALPSYSRDRGLLSFCFVDPFDLRLRFNTIRTLARNRTDFLVLLMLGVDGRRNFGSYLHDASSIRIAEFIDSPDWRNEFTRMPGRANPLRFLLDRFDQRMVELGYLSAKHDSQVIYAHGTHVLQYVLAFYSKHELGLKFWRDTRRTLSPQAELF